MRFDLVQRLVCLLLVALMLNMSFVPAFADDLPADPVSFSDDDVLTGGPPTIIDTPRTAEFSCSTPESAPRENVLLPEEVQKLKRKTDVEHPGFSGDSISSGRGRNEDREELENNLIVQTGDGGDAIVNELPNSKMDTGEMSPWFYKHISGPFAFGVSLDDTMRIGQCRDLEGLEAEERGCPVKGTQISYRNNGAGVIQNVKTVWEDVKSIFTGEETGQYTAEEVENLQTKIIAETDMNSLQARSFSRKVDLIPNSVLTDDFVASMDTTGDDSGSLISIYSMFDKYFNSWFSTEMVVSTFGPTLFGQAKKYTGWMARRGWPWDLSNNTAVSWFRRKFMDPHSLLGKARLQRMVTRADKYGFGDAWTKGIEGTGNWDSGYSFIKGGSFRKMLNDWSKPGGYLDTIDDPIRRGEFFKQIKDLRTYAHTNKASYDFYSKKLKDAVTKFGDDSAEAKAAYMALAKNNADTMLKADDRFLRLDASELWAKEEATGLYNVAVQQKGLDNFIPLNGDSKHIGIIQRGFIKDSWGSSSFPYKTTDEGFLKIYKLSPKGKLIDEVPVEDLQKNFSRFVDKAAMTERGELIKIDNASVGWLMGESGTGKVKIYNADWVPIDPDTPEMYARRLNSARGDRISTTFSGNMDRLYNTLVEKNFAGQSRRYYNILDKAFSQEQEILKSYFSLKGGAKWTVMPFLYWQGKRGFGFEGLSAFQLPDTWQSIELYTEDEKIFDDAFMDILAQHGSDEGEIFSQVLNKLPWKMALDYVSKNFNPVDSSYKNLTNPMGGWRRDVENVAYFTSTRDDCATCHISLIPKVTSQYELQELKQKGRGKAVITFEVEQDMKSYFVEDILDNAVKEEGTTLIAFGHHTNLRGEEAARTGQETEPIDLVEAKKEKTRCQDAIREVGIGGLNLGFLGDNPQRAGAILAFGESMGYFLFFWSGIIGSVLQQTLLTPKLQDCVDDVDGYFLHMYASYDASKEGGESPNEKGSKTAGDVVQGFNEIVLGKKPVAVEKDDDADYPVDETGYGFTSAERNEGDERISYNRNDAGEQSTGSILQGLKEKVANEAEKLSKKAQSSAILQLEVKTMGKNHGTTTFEKMFFFWFKGNTQQAVYDSQSKSIIEDSETGVSVIVDKEAGKIQVKEEGKPAETVITSEDHVRLSGPDGRVPAEVIPQRIGSVILPDGPGVELFEMDWKGNLKVLDQGVLDCIKRNVEEQTGVPLRTNNISDAFGETESIVTDTYPSITASPEDKTITANGSPREIVYGESARVLVMSDMNTVMSNGAQYSVGNMQSVQFKNGVILFKPASSGKPAELIIWIRYHEKSILRRSDVKGLKASVADPVTNAETGCPEPAIDLEAIPNLDAGADSAITERVSNFNTSIKKMGPFQVFDTDRHRFVFYSEKTSPTCSVAEEGCCQERVSVIDKQTGEVYDQAIVGGIKQTPTGIKFTTDDGKKHALDFSADNGIPTLTYNDMAPETLTMARGPNGAFWYDPEEETWRPYNAQLLPLLEDFKKRGFDTRHREDCSSSTLPGSNTMNVEIGGAADTPFNLPSIPKHPMAMLLFFLSLVAVICAARFKIEKKFET